MDLQKQISAHSGRWKAPAFFDEEDLKVEQRSYLRDFLFYTALNVLGMIGLSCYILADTFFISKGLGANGLAALNLAIPIYSFIHGSGLMLGIGGATKYSIFKGQRAHKNADQVFSNTLYAGGILILIFLSAGLFLSGKITVLLGADEEIYAMTKTYLQVILLFSPAFMMNDILICFVRNDGSPSLSMTAMLVGSFANIILDYIFIFSMGLGIFGAVLATGFAPVISMMILSIHWLKKRSHFRFKWIKPQPKMMGSMLALGVPSLISEVASGIVIIVFNMIILKLLGNVGVAAYGVVANLSLVVVSVYTGIAQGMQPLVSKSYGYGDAKGIQKTLMYALITMGAVSAVIYAGILLFADPIAGIFNSEQNLKLQKIAVDGLKLYFLAVPFVGFNIVISMFFTSTEKAVPAQMVSLLRGMILIIPMAFLFSSLWGITGVWITFPVTEGIVALLGFVWYSLNSKQKAG